MENQKIDRREIITPERAQELLDVNHVNRPISWSWVNGMARDMESGFFKTNSSIAICTKGYLRDGQHRLLAIVKSGKPQELLVTYGVDPDTLFDLNRPRNAVDSLTIGHVLDKELCNSRYVAMTRFIIGYSCTVMLSTHKEIENYILENIVYFRKLHEVVSRKKNKHFNKGAVNLAIYGAIRSGMDLDVLKSFFEKLNTGFQESEKDYPVIAIRNKLIEVENLTLSSVQRTNEYIRKIQYAIREYARGSAKKTVRDPGDFIYPIK